MNAIPLQKHLPRSSLGSFLAASCAEFTFSSKSSMKVSPGSSALTLHHASRAGVLLLSLPAVCQHRRSETPRVTLRAGKSSLIYSRLLPVTHVMP